MKIEIGESLIRSWLRHIKHCEFAELNWKPSPAWQTMADETVAALFESAKQGNPSAIGQNTLSQFLKQAEVDVFGLSASNDKLHLVDIAFHSGGLNYGGQGKTGERIFKKLVRSALIAKTYFPGRAATVYFVTPKASPAIKREIETACERVKALFEGEDEIEFELIIEHDFKVQLIDPVLSLGSEVADTSELFLRSWQLIQPVIEYTSTNQDQVVPEPTVQEYTEVEREAVPDDVLTVNEVNRVAGRLTLWANNTHQINARILNAYLALKRSGASLITVGMLQAKYGEANFNTNFVQMRNIAANNHGKIFELNGELVEIWQPVRHLVDEYERAILSA
jgi:hypothetical protein